VVTSEENHSSESAFAAHLQKHGRDAYSDPREFQERFALYQIRAAEVEKHNRQPNRLWTAGLNHLSDRTDVELKQLLGYKGMKPMSPSQGPSSRQRSMLSKKPLPEEKSYGNYANQRFIRDQGQCGSCWAVTASTVLGAHSELWGTNRSFSTQEIVDCVPNPNKCGGKGGCDGATVELAMQYAMKKGIRKPSEYGDYKARDGLCDQTINDKSSPSLKDLTVFDSASQVFLAEEAAPGRLFGMTGWEKLASNRYQPLMEALYFKGPVAVSIAANSMFSYSSGIFDGCTDFIVNHAVTLIGYGKEGKSKFYEIQNSWGPSWGEGGRFRVRRLDNEEEHCGMDDKPEEGVACEGDTEPARVCGTCGLLFDSVIPHFGSKA
jgi:cathepsin L